MMKKLFRAAVVSLFFLCAGSTGCGQKPELVISVQEDSSAEKMNRTESSGDELSEVPAESEPAGDVTEAEGKNVPEGTQEDEAAVIVVYVTGAVVSPGVYELRAGARAADAVDAAGGFRDDAEREYVNLAAPVSDGMQIRIPTVEEAENLTEKQPAGSRFGLISGGSGAESLKSLVNINTADAELLMTLPGIGKAKAEAIIAYRTEHGPFSEIGEIRKVSGIKESTYKNIEHNITVG